jgi:hypothetical protein
VNGELPAAAAGQEEADEEVVLRMGIDGLNFEHRCLASKDDTLVTGES